MAYPLPVVRRRRRRRLLWLAVVGSIFVAIGVLAVRFIDERSRTMDYMEAARDTATTFDALAVRAEAIVDGLEEADRPALLGLLNDTSVDAAAAQNALLAFETPDDLGTAAGFLTTAVAAWRDGLVELESGIARLLDDPSSIEGEASLSGAFLDFRVGDRAYRSFAVLIADEAGERPFPDVMFVSPGRELRYNATLVTERLAAVETLAARHDIAIPEVRFDPPPTGSREGRAVIPFSPTLNLEVTVVNRGNEPEADIPVRMRLVSLGGDIVDEETQLIAALGPGEASSLLFEALAVEPGEFYEVILIADLATDEVPASNEYSESFYRNDST